MKCESDYEKVTLNRKSDTLKRIHTYDTYCLPALCRAASHMLPRDDLEQV